MAIIQSAIGGGHAAAVDAIFTNPNAVGNTILVFAIWDSVADPKTITDTNHNDYTVLHAPVGSGLSLGCFIAQNIVAGANTVAINSGGGGDFMILGVIEDDNIAASPSDQFAFATSSALLLDSGPTSPTTHAKDLIIGWGGNESSGATYTAGAGFAMVQQFSDVPNGQALGIEFMEVTTVGVQEATMTQSGAFGSVMAVIALKRGGSTPGGSKGKGPNIMSTEIFGAEIISPSTTIMGTSRRTRISR